MTPLLAFAGMTHVGLVSGVAAAHKGFASCAERLIVLLERLEPFLYPRAQAVGTVTSAFATDIARRGIAPSKVYVVPNGVDLETFRPGPGDPVLRRRLGLGDELLVQYCGAHGISHALSRILDVTAGCGTTRGCAFSSSARVPRRRCWSSYRELQLGT